MAVSAKSDIACSKPSRSRFFFHGDRKADPLEAVRNEAGVDCGVGERRVRIGAVRDDESDAAASRGGRGGFRRGARRQRRPRLAPASLALRSEAKAPVRIGSTTKRPRPASRRPSVGLLSSPAPPGREESPAYRTSPYAEPDHLRGPVTYSSAQFDLLGSGALRKSPRD